MPDTLTIFGPLVPSSNLENAVITTLQTWLPTYVTAVEREQSLTVPTLARPRSWQTSYDFQNWAEGQLPAIVCVCPGTSSPFEKVGDGNYQAWFEVGVGALIEDTTEPSARRVAQLYQVAIEGVMLQRSSLTNFATGMELYNRRSELPDSANRTLAYAESIFHVFVENIVNSQAGPATPDPPFDDSTLPWPDFEQVKSTHVDFTGIRVDDE